MAQHRPPLYGDDALALRRRIVMSLTIVVLLLGLLLVAWGFSLEPGSTQRQVVSGLGLAFLPAGIVALLLIGLAERPVESVLERIEQNVQHQLDRQINGSLVQIVDDLRTSLGDTIRRDIEVVSVKLREFAPLFESSTRLGVLNVHTSRADALSEFSLYLESEFEKVRDANMTITVPPPARVWIVSSSLKGFLDTSLRGFDGRSILQQSALLAEKGFLDLRILMTDPRRGDQRAVQEGRPQGGIPSEIESNVGILKGCGVKHNMVRFYAGTPTVFAIATSDKMLINPYPYGAEAFRFFTLTVARTTRSESDTRRHDEDIYRQYEKFHFLAPWQHGTFVPQEAWDRVSAGGAEQREPGASEATPPVTIPTT